MHSELDLAVAHPELAVVVAEAPRFPSAPPDSERTQIAPLPTAAQLVAEGGPTARLVETCRRELDQSPPPARAARLHAEIARALGSSEEALRHYEKALELHPDFVVALQGRRRVLLDLGRAEEASELFDAEIHLAAEPRQRARLAFDKGRALEDVAGDPEAARACYVEACRLEPSVPLYFKALAQSQASARDFGALAEARSGDANAVRGDSRHRAAIIAERARLFETRLGRLEEATELYQQVLDIDPQASSALTSLKRLLHEQRRWRELVTVLEREASQARDPAIVTQALFRIGRIYGERLGSREDSVAALARAMQSSPSDRLVLDSLARIYEAASEHAHLASVLAHTVDTVAEPAERIALLHRIGGIYEKQLEDDEQARRWYEASLGIDVAYMPSIHALDNLYERLQAWESLIVMHMAMSDAVADASRRAGAHARIAEIFESRLASNDEAMRHHELALSLDPGLETSFKALVRLYEKHQRHRELIELYERGIDRVEQQDVVIAYLFKVGHLFENQLRDPVQAAFTYERILALSPRDIGAIHAAQRAYERAYRHGDLVDALQREIALTESKDRKVALLQRAGDVLADKVGDAEEALLRFRRVLELDPQYGPALVSLGKLFQRLGRHQDRRDIYERELEVTTTESRKVELLFAMGEICEHHLGDDDEAIRYYQKAVALDPDHGPSLRALAFQLQRRKDYPTLVEAYRAELGGNLRPAVRAGTCYRLGEVYEIHLEDYPKAVEAYESALAAWPDYRPAIDALSRVRTRLRDWERQAADLMAEAGRVKDQRLAIDAMLRSGEIQAELLDRPEAAVEAFEAVRRVEPDNLAALLALERLYRVVGRWPQLDEVYARQAAVLADPRARIAVLEERARLLETKLPGDAAEIRRIYSAILSVDGTHHGALRGLERLALLAADRALLADVDGRYARAESDAGVVAGHQTRLGESLETDNPQAALAAYRAALERDPENIAAIRGLGRAAELAGDWAAIIESCRREASWTRIGETAADVLVKSARVRIEKLGDTPGAIEDAERALERWPDHELAARTLSDLLRESGEVDRLVTLLSRAAASATAVERTSALWRVVARLYAEEKRDLGAARGALERLLKQHPPEAATYQLLGDIHTKNRAPQEAADAYRHAIELSPPPERRLAIDLSLGRLYAKVLRQPASAVECLEHAVGLDPHCREALELLLEIHNAAQDNGKARLTAQQLIKVATRPDERAWGLLQLAQIELRDNRRRQAAEALRAAVALTGATSEAAKLYKTLLGEEEPWERYTEALRDHLRRVRAGEIESTDLRAVFLELARTEHEVLLNVEAAVRSLREGLEMLGKDLVVHQELADRLATTGRADEAVAEYRRIVRQEPASVLAWRGMARIFHEGGRKLEAGIVLAPLVILGEATELEAGMSRQKRLQAGHAPPGSFDANVLRRVTAGDGWEEMRIGALFAAISDALLKMYPPDLESYGVTTRERVRAEHPLRLLCDQLAMAFGVEAFDMYVTPGQTTDVVVELFDTPALMVPKFVEDLPEEQRAFILARAFVMLARGMHAVVTLGWREIAKVVAAALRMADPTFASGRHNDDEITALAHRLHKSMSRKGRKLLETATPQCLSKPTIDVERWGPTVERTTARAAALIANDLPAAVTVLQLTGAAPGNLGGAALLQKSSIVADLFRFWATDAAFDVRHGAGIL